jgi:hypothetical protein
VKVEKATLSIAASRLYVTLDSIDVVFATDSKAQLLIVIVNETDKGVIDGFVAREPTRLTACVPKSFILVEATVIVKAVPSTLTKLKVGVSK